MNVPHPDRKSPSAFFLQTSDGFIQDSKKLQFRLKKRSQLEKISDLTSNISHLRFRRGAGSLDAHFAFAQLVNFSGDTHLELIIYSRPMRLYSIKNLLFQDVTNKIGVPKLIQVQDVAVEDFNGKCISRFINSSGHRWSRRSNSTQLTQNQVLPL